MFSFCFRVFWRITQAAEIVHMSMLKMTPYFEARDTVDLPRPIILGILNFWGVSFDVSLVFDKKGTNVFSKSIELESEWKVGLGPSWAGLNVFKIFCVNWQARNVGNEGSFIPIITMYDSIASFPTTGHLVHDRDCCQYIWKNDSNQPKLTPKCLDVNSNWLKFARRMKCLGIEKPISRWILQMY